MKAMTANAARTTLFRTTTLYGYLREALKVLRVQLWSCEARVHCMIALAMAVASPNASRWIWSRHNFPRYRLLVH